MTVLKILVILVMLAVVRGSSIMRKNHRSGDESANLTRNAHNEDKRLKGQRRQQAGLHLHGPRRLQANIWQFYVQDYKTINYYYAQKECRAKRGGFDLAVLDTSDKWEKIKKGIKKGGHYWVGVRKNTGQLKWLWRTGEPLKKRAAGGRLSIHHPEHRCMILYFEGNERIGDLREADCYEEAFYICDKS